MDDTSIRVPRAVRDRLAELAADQGTTVKDLISALAAEPTHAELATRRARTRGILADLGTDPDDDAPEAAQADEWARQVWANLHTRNAPGGQGAA